MKREFIATSVFDRRWKDLSLSDDNLQALQNFIMRNPSVGDVIVGTGGAIKIRYPLPGKGKSGGVRVIFVDLAHKERVYLLLCYTKSEQDNFTDAQKKQLELLIKVMKEES
jgi:hypothetical protein